MEAMVIEQVFRNEAGRVLATLIRLAGGFDIAEEALQDAFAAALERWPATGLPANPRAWLVKTGRNKAIDRLRRTISLRAKLGQIEMTGEPDSEPEAIADDMLRLIFTCCHPALAMETRVALTLRTLCGLETAAVARAFLVSEEAMAQRIVRAKTKIRQAGIPYKVPSLDMLDARLDDVLATIYLVFTEGYADGSGEDHLRNDLATEAIRLGRLLMELLPGRAAVEGLLALMLLHNARNASRRTADGAIALLEEQDRSLWDQSQIADGRQLVETSLRRPGRPGSYAVQAAIAALHAGASSYDRTDWPQIAGLYAILVQIHPSPVIELNRAAALAMVEGPAKALEIVDTLVARGQLSGYAPLMSARAELLSRLGRCQEAVAAYRTALAQAKHGPERQLLERRLAALQTAGCSLGKGRYDRIH